MAKAMKKSDRNRYVWRDAQSGRFLDVEVPDPPVKLRGVSISKIRQAVKKAGGGASMRTKSK